MSVVIPWARIASVTLRQRLFTGEQEGTLGGADLPIPRMGDRFVADVTTTQLLQDDESRVLIATLIEASVLDARIAIYQPSIVLPGNVGAPVVDGAGQSGSTIAVRGVLPGLIVKHGQFFNLVHAGVRSIFMATADVGVGGDGRVAIPVWPMLRFRTVDGEGCMLRDVMIEGKLSGFDRGATYQGAKVAPLSLTISERS